MKLEEVAEAWGAVDAHQDAVLHGCAEAHCQAVGARAGPVVGRPGIEDEASALPEDVRGASCETKERGSVRALQAPARGGHRAGTAQAAWSTPAFTRPDLETKRDATQGLRRRPSPQIKEAGDMS